MTNKYLKLTCPTPKSWHSHNPALPAAISYLDYGNSVLPVGKANNIGVLFDFSFLSLLFLPSNAAANPVGFLYSEFNHFSAPALLLLVWATIFPCLDYCSLFTGFFILSLLLSSMFSHTSQNDPSKDISSFHSSVQILQWLPISLTVNAKVISKACHAIPHTPPQAPYFCCHWLISSGSSYCPSLICLLP